MRTERAGTRLALSLFFLAAACSKQPPARFTAEEPAGWKTEETKGADSARTFRSGKEEISATIYGRPGSFYAEPKDLFNSLAGAGNVIRPVEETTVAGRKVSLFRGIHDEPMNGGVFAEDWVFVTVPEGFWALRYRRPASPPSSSGAAPADDVWKRFVGTFKPVP